MMRSYEKGEEVFIRDYPLGKPTNIRGKVVGFIGEDFFNVEIMNGWNAGNIITYKYWKLYKKSKNEKNT